MITNFAELLRGWKLESNKVEDRCHLRFCTLPKDFCERGDNYLKGEKGEEMREKKIIIFFFFKL